MSENSSNESTFLKLKNASSSGSQNQPPMGDASLFQDQGMDTGGDPNAMGGEPMDDAQMGGDPNAMNDEPNAMGGEPMDGGPMGDEPMGDEPMGDEPMDGEGFDENPDSSEDEKVNYGTSIFKGLSPQNQDAAIAYMQSMEDTDGNGDEGGSQEGAEDEGIPQDGQGDEEQGQPLMEVILTKKQVKKLSETLMQTDTKNNERDNRKPLNDKQSKGSTKSPFNSPKFD